MTKNPKADLCAKFLKLQEEARAAYREADQIMEQLSTGARNGKVIAKKYRMKDNFAGKNILWGHGPVRRWEIEVIESGD